MNNDVHVEQMEIGDRGDLLDFLRKAYTGNPRPGDPAFWNWHFLEVQGSGTAGIPVWVAKSGGCIAGQLGAIPVELDLDGETVSAIWILDLIVDAEFRRRGIAKRLVRAAEGFCPVMLGVNTMEQHAPVLLQSLGWTIVTKIPRFHKILFPGDAIDELSGVRGLRTAVNTIWAPFRPRTRKSPFGTGENLRIVNRFDSSFDDLWNRARGQWPCAVVRDSKMLAWQYEDQPGKKFDIVGYYESERLLGYAVLFFRKKGRHGALPKAAITDLCYSPDNPVAVVDALISASLQICLERRSGGLVTDVIDPLIEDRLRFHGFWRVKNPLQLMVKSPTREDLLLDPQKWFLTRGDSDISIFEEPNLPSDV